MEKSSEGLCVRIIGIDPGSRYTGIGIIDQTGNQLKYVHSEIVSTVHKEELEERLLVIFNRLSDVIREFQPQTASIEKIFHSVNAHSSLILGHARGVAILSAKLQELDIKEYAPNEIKSAITGVGRASKAQVGSMVQILLNLNRNKKMKEDESDALAIAICHANTMDFAIRSKILQR